MRGSVEVFSIESDGTERLIASESNLVVDGAGRTIVDMLTTPSSILGIHPQVMDASNWRLGAMSFGPAGGNFGNDPGYLDSSCGEAYSLDGSSPALVRATAYYVTSEAIATPGSWVGTDRVFWGNRIIRPLWVSAHADITNVTASSYTPPHKLPAYPDPKDTKLENVNTAYVNVSADGTVSYGQFENRIEYGINDNSSYCTGAYAVSWNANDADSNNIFIYAVSSLDADFAVNRGANMVASADGIGSTHSYNGRDGGNVDYRGFIRLLPNRDAATSYTDSPAWDEGGGLEWNGRAWFSGVGTQTSATDLCADPLIEVTTRIHYDDQKMFLAFGGLHHIGLWTLNLKDSMVNSPPGYVWTLDSDGANDMEWRLFAKKTFTENLVRAKDDGINAGLQANVYLVIKWRLDLRS